MDVDIKKEKEEEFNRLRFLRSSFLSDPKNQEKEKFYSDLFRKLSLRVGLISSTKDHDFDDGIYYSSVYSTVDKTIYIAENVADGFIKKERRSLLTVLHEVGHIICIDNDMSFVDHLRIFINSILLGVGCRACVDNGNNMRSHIAYHEGFANLFSGWMFTKVASESPEKYLDESVFQIEEDLTGYPETPLKNREVMKGADMRNDPEVNHFMSALKTPFDFRWGKNPLKKMWMHEL